MLVLARWARQGEGIRSGCCLSLPQSCNRNKPLLARFGGERRGRPGPHEITLRKVVQGILKEGDRSRVFRRIDELRMVYTYGG